VRGVAHVLDVFTSSTLSFRITCFWTVSLRSPLLKFWIASSAFSRSECSLTILLQRVQKPLYAMATLLRYYDRND
jgi:hypothetical protein